MKYRLKEIREQAGVTIEELAKKSGVSRNWIWKIENGKATSVSVNVLLALAMALNKDVDDLFFLED